MNTINVHVDHVTASRAREHHVNVKQGKIEECQWKCGSPALRGFLSAAELPGDLPHRVAHLRICSSGTPWPR